MSSARSSDEDLNMILVMGVTGAGKSYFINKLAGGEIARTGENLKSCTAECEIIPANVGKSKIVLVDTPGFDDSSRTDSQILTEISRLLAIQYQEGLKLKGVVYLHRITDVRYQGSSVKTLKIFKEICGQLALKNVLLVTTRWNEMDEGLGARREKELRDSFWAYMLRHGSTMARFYDDGDSARAIVSQLLGKPEVVLQLQRELVDDQRPLQQTGAGNFVSEELTELKAYHVKQINDLDVLKQDLRENDRAMRRQIERDSARERQRLQIADEDEARLRRQLIAELRQEIEQTKKSKKSKWKKAIPLVPSLLALFELVAKIPVGSNDTLTTWFSESGFNESAGDFLSNS